MVVNSFRETKIYQEAFLEGYAIGIVLVGVARRMLAKKYPVEEIAEVTGLTPTVIKKLQKKPRK